MRIVCLILAAAASAAASAEEAALPVAPAAAQAPAAAPTGTPASTATRVSALIAEAASSPAASQELATLVRSGSPADATIALTLIADRRPDNADALVAGALGRSEPEVLRRALSVMAAAEQADAQSLAAVRPLLEHPDPKVQTAAIRTLGAVGEDEVTALAGKLASGNPQVAREARTTLIGISGGRDFGTAEGWMSWSQTNQQDIERRLGTLSEQVRSSDPATVETAIHHLALLSGQRERRGALLASLVEHENPDIARLATAAMARLESRSGHPVDAGKPIDVGAAAAFVPLPRSPAPTLVQELRAATGDRWFWPALLGVWCAAAGVLAGVVYMLRSPPVRVLTQRIKRGTKRIAKHVTDRIQKGTRRVARKISERIARGTRRVAREKSAAPANAGPALEPAVHPLPLAAAAPAAKESGKRPTQA